VVDRDRENGNGAAAGYAWTVDPIARDRLGRLEEQGHAHETRLDAIEATLARRKGRLDDLAGLGKAIAWTLGILGTVGGLVLSYLNLVRH
jgi:hypothetical protein